MLQEPPSWQLAVLHQSFLHLSLVQRRTHTHTLYSMCMYSDSPRWLVSPLILIGCLHVCRCLYHPWRCGGGDHRWLCGLQHPLHHWCLRDLRWTGVCACVWETWREWLPAAAPSFCLFIDRRAAHVWQKFFAEGKQSHLLQLVFSELVLVETQN